MEYLQRVENEYQLSAQASITLAILEEKIKEYKEQADNLKQAILSEMEEQNIIKVETDEVSISYIAPTSRETFDSKKLREDNPDLYDEYIKISPVKASIRVKVK